MQTLVVSDHVELREQTDRLLSYYLGDLERNVATLTISVDSVRDSLDNDLYRCRAEVLCTDGETIVVDETQADLTLVVTRLLDRTVRTLHRRSHWAARQRLR